MSTPDDDVRLGHVGRALPGIEIRIDEPDAAGVGEVLARGPNVMLGYFGGDSGAPMVDRAATDAVLREGWLRTGDLGRLDAQGRLSIVGRKKDVIIDANGKNVYPDEVEELYQAPGVIQELCAVGLPDPEGEKVALLVVPAPGSDPGEARRLVEAHLRRVTAALPFHKRAKVWHLVDEPLPRTATRKVRRPSVVLELQRLEATAVRDRRGREGAARGAEAWVLDTVAAVARRPRESVTVLSSLAGDLGFDSLMMTELQAALDEAGVPAPLVEQAAGTQTAGDLVRLVGASLRRPDEREQAVADGTAPRRPEALAVPEAVQALGRAVFGAAQRALYGTAYGARVEGQIHVPVDRNVLVVANHSSHLDMGLVKFALGDQGKRLAAMAAADYFFDTPLKRAYFENFTNLVPMERSGSVRKSLRSATTALKRGYNLLLFPEGTRSPDGQLLPFRPTAGYLALHCGVDTLPVYLHGTHEAMPKGAAVPRKAELRVAIGPVIRVEDLRQRTADLPKGEAHKVATLVMEEAVKELRDRVLAGAAGTHAPPAGQEPPSHPAAGSAAEDGRPPARAVEDQT